MTDDFFRTVRARVDRAEEARREKLDIAGRAIRPGDIVAYAVSLGRSAGLQIAEVVSLSTNGGIRLKIDERYRKTYGTKSIVTVQFPDRMVILEPLSDPLDPTKPDPNDVSFGV